jgi:hypothetical protein
MPHNQVADLDIGRKGPSQYGKRKGAIFEIVSQAFIDVKLYSCRWLMAGPSAG